MRYQYLARRPFFRPGASAEDVEDWLNEKDSEGWEFVGYAQQVWSDGAPTQQWWIFRKPRSNQ